MRVTLAYRSRVFGASFAARVRSHVATSSRNGVDAVRGSMKSPELIAAACADSQRSASRLSKVLTRSLRRFAGLGMRAW